MHKLIQCLQAWGCDEDCVQSRFLGDEKFYLEMLTLMERDKSAEALNQAIAAGDLKAGFAAAHTLKGMAGNMGITPLYMPVCALVESLRVGDDSNLSAQLAAVLEANERFLAIMRENPIEG